MKYAIFIPTTEQFEYMSEQEVDDNKENLQNKEYYSWKIIINTDLLNQQL